MLMPDNAPSADLVVPRVVLSLPRAVVPDIELSNDDSPVEQPFVGDLILFYGFDQPSYFTMVAQRDLTRLALDKQRLHAVAVTNLRRTIPQPELHQISPGVFMLTCGGNFEATTLLLDEVWQQVTAKVSGDLVVAVPARDIVIFTGGDNRDGLAFMRSKVSHILEVGDHTLTRHFLVRSESGWRVYEGFAA
jgi:uncharacterized protein YtpQ (UPF0354 family)